MRGDIILVGDEHGALADVIISTDDDVEVVAR